MAERRPELWIVRHGEHEWHVVKRWNIQAPEEERG